MNSLLNIQDLQKRKLEGTNVSYYLYVPSSGGNSVPIFITVHGWSRNAREHAEGYLAYAETYGVVLLAPLFERRQFPQYQQLGNSIKKGRADYVLDSIIAEAGRLTGAQTNPLYLFGYSGGGQFVQRYTMAHPERVARIALGAPGWYTFPDAAQAFPLGIGPSKHLTDIRFEPSRFLKIPAKVLVGELDTHRNHHFNASRKIDQAQGVNRQERAIRWVQAMTAAARVYGYETDYSLELLPDSDHSFTTCMEKGHMGKIVFGFLFGQRPR